MNVSRASLDRKLRYRAIIANLNNLEDESTQEERINQTTNALQEAEILLAEACIEERVKHPGEGYLDSKVIRSSSDQVVKCSYLITGNVNTYDKHELAAHIRENPAYWDFLFPKEIPPAPFLFGTFAPTPPEERPKVIRQKVGRQKVAAVKTPENVERLEKTDEGSEMVMRVKKFISRTFKENKSKPISYFHLVLDPKSFSRTVENIYYMSFLARDSVISVQSDEETGLPFILPYAAESRDEHDGEESQFIVSINKKRWTVLVDAFKLTEPLMVINRL